MREFPNDSEGCSIAVASLGLVNDSTVVFQSTRPRMDIAAAKCVHAAKSREPGISAPEIRLDATVSSLFSRSQAPAQAPAQLRRNG